MRTKFIDSVKAAFKDHGYGSVGSPSEEDTGGIFIVGVCGTFIYTSSQMADRFMWVKDSKIGPSP
jgi:hypothetical protein